MGHISQDFEPSEINVPFRDYSYIQVVLVQLFESCKRFGNQFEPVHKI
jgi:hypothetical protein